MAFREKMFDPGVGPHVTSIVKGSHCGVDEHAEVCAATLRLVNAKSPANMSECIFVCILQEKGEGNSSRVLQVNEMVS